uniref:TM2 domain-containing protein n=1 Tax=Agathobacter sp. TaxID=2021311 RepID=UPI0040564000
MSGKNTQIEFEGLKIDEEAKNKNEKMTEISKNDTNEMNREIGNCDVEEGETELNESDVNDGEKETEDSDITPYVPKTEAEVVRKKKEDRKKAVKVLLSKTSEEDKQVSDKEKMEALMGVAMATEELRQLKKEYGIEDQLPKRGGKISRKVSSWFERNENQEPIPINKKKYILLALLTGWFGGHRFYVKHYRVGLIYLLLCWAGIGLYHSMVDIMIAIPMKPDENGDIMV